MNKKHKFIKVLENHFRGAVQACAFVLLILMLTGTQKYSATADPQTINSTTTVHANNAIFVEYPGNIYDFISTLVNNLKEKIFAKSPKNINIMVNNNILEIKMHNVPKNWSGKIIFEDKSGYGNYEKEFGYKDMIRNKNLYKYTVKAKDLPNGTYDISICDKNNRVLFVEKDVVLNFSE